MERVNNLIQDVENAVHLRETLKVMEKSKWLPKHIHQSIVKHR